MTPSTDTIAILFAESLSSTTASSSFGPAVRVGAAAPLTSNLTICSGFKTSVIASKQANIIVATFHPLPVRRGGGGAASRGGGGGIKGGGTGGPGGGLDGGISVS